MTKAIKGEAEACAAFMAHCSERYAELDRLERYAYGNQYEGRPGWNDEGDDSVYDRAPCIVWAAPSGAATANEDLLLGEGRFPTVTSRPDEDSGESENEREEDAEEELSKTLDRLVLAVERQAKLRQHFRANYVLAQLTRSCVTVGGIRAGRLHADVVEAKHCLPPEYDVDGNVSKLEIWYPYLDTLDVRGEPTRVCRIYRRVIDTVRDVTYLPPVVTATTAPVWQEDPSKTVAHGLGFCPVEWHKFRRPSTVSKSVDGIAIHELVTDELDGFNLEASIRHDGAVFSLPQVYECGVEPGYNPTGSIDNDPGLVGSATGGRISPDNPQTEHYKFAHSGKKGRVKGPKRVWQYADPNTKVDQLELSAGALDSLSQTMADLRSRIAESLAWVALNPEDIRFASSVSGKALERLMARQLNRVALDREGFGEYMLRVYGLMLRIVSVGGTGLKIRGIAKMLPSLSIVTDGGDWFDPPLTLRWGTWFQPVPEDDQKLVDMTIKALGAGLITLRTAVEKLQRTFGIKNIDTYVEALKAEAQEKSMGEHGALALLLGKLHGDDYATPGRKPGGVRPKGEASGDGGDNRALDDALTKQGQGAAPSVFGG